MDLAGSRIARCAKFLEVHGILKDPAPFSWKFLALHRCATNFLGFAGVSLHHVNFPYESVGCSWMWQEVAFHDAQNSWELRYFQTPGQNSAFDDAPFS